MDDEYSDGCEDTDDIAQFERRLLGNLQNDGASSSDEDPELKRAQAVRKPLSTNDWEQKCIFLEHKIKEKDEVITNLRQDLALHMNADDTAIEKEMRGKLIELTKKTRKQAVALESQKTKNKQLSLLVKKMEEAGVKEPLGNLNAAPEIGIDDFKKKYLQASNKLQELRQECQGLKVQVHRQRKVLLKEMGEAEVEKALATADDPSAVQFKGRAAQITNLQRQVKELKEQLSHGTPDVLEMKRETPKETVSKEAEQRRLLIEKLQTDVSSLQSEKAESKRKLDAVKSRNATLEQNVRSLKKHVETLLQKSDNDDELVSALKQGHQSDTNVADLRMQIERQAAIIQMLRQQRLQDRVEDGMMPAGHMAEDDQLRQRVALLEVENERQAAHIDLLERETCRSSDDDRPISAGSMSAVRDRLDPPRKTGQHLRSKQRDRDYIDRDQY